MCTHVFDVDASLGGGHAAELARVQRLLRQASPLLQQQRGVVCEGVVKHFQPLAQRNPEVGEEVVGDEVQQLLRQLGVAPRGALQRQGKLGARQPHQRHQEFLHRHRGLGHVLLVVVVLVPAPGVGPRRQVLETAVETLVDHWSLEVVGGDARVQHHGTKLVQRQPVQLARVLLLQGIVVLVQRLQAACVLAQHLFHRKQVLVQSGWVLSHEVRAHKLVQPVKLHVHLVQPLVLRRAYLAFLAPLERRRVGSAFPPGFEGFRSVAELHRQVVSVGAHLVEHDVHVQGGTVRGQNRLRDVNHGGVPP
mmetsp:Transcript_14125/g.27079  ORF Transcript_14125/g.27079 Transcript_14125/m.27079 type:complete len:306 (-) Transcript_14125:242-1159(-)